MEKFGIETQMPFSKINHGDDVDKIKGWLAGEGMGPPSPQVALDN
jgi:hypothetical protein